MPNLLNSVLREKEEGKDRVSVMSSGTVSEV